MGEQKEENMKRTSRQRIPDPIEVPLPDIAGQYEPDARHYQMGRCSVTVGTILKGSDPLFPGYHLSISHPHRYPTWDEVAHARYKLIPNDVIMVMVLPPKEEYINLDENCFHLHEIKGKPKWVTIVDPRGKILGRQLK